MDLAKTFGLGGKSTINSTLANESQTTTAQVVKLETIARGLNAPRNTENIAEYGANPYNDTLKFGSPSQTELLQIGATKEPLENVYRAIADTLANEIIWDQGRVLVTYLDATNQDRKLYLVPYRSVVYIEAYGRSETVNASMEVLKAKVSGFKSQPYGDVHSDSDEGSGRGGNRNNLDDYSSVGHREKLLKLPDQGGPKSVQKKSGNDSVNPFHVGNDSGGNSDSESVAFSPLGKRKDNPNLLTPTKKKTDESSTSSSNEISTKEPKKPTGKEGTSSKSGNEDTVQ